MRDALATVLYQGSVLPCIEAHGRFHPFATLNDGASLPASIAALFEDWARYHPTLARAAVMADALDAFRHGRWDVAASKFEALGQTPADSKLATLYLGRITHFRQHPPTEGWDGVTNFTTK